MQKEPSTKSLFRFLSAVHFSKIAAVFAGRPGLDPSPIHERVMLPFLKDQGSCLTMSVTGIIEGRREH